jgi:hypothetical protein
LVPRPRFELGTPAFSVRCSTKLSYLGTADDCIGREDPRVRDILSRPAAGVPHRTPCRGSRLPAEWLQDHRYLRATLVLVGLPRPGGCVRYHRARYRRHRRAVVAASHSGLRIDAPGIRSDPRMSTLIRAAWWGRNGLKRRASAANRTENCGVNSETPGMEGGYIPRLLTPAPPRRVYR